MTMSNASTIPVSRTARIDAPAKINVRLKVTGQRPDGYHDLVSVMVPVSLFDRLELTVAPGDAVRLTCTDPSLPDGEDNLVVRAARAFLARAGLRRSVSVTLTKRIPSAAGLGGGSSDAACTLNALNTMLSHPLSREELARTALGLGADVPFFLNPVPSLARGVGEILEPIAHWPHRWYVIVMPPLSVSTSWAYRNLKLELTSGDYEYIVKFLEKQPFEIAPILENDLETVTVSRFPILGAIKTMLLDAGAEGALMSGSGPSVFGVFSSRAHALGARRALSAHRPGRLFVTESLNPVHWGVVKR